MDIDKLIEEYENKSEEFLIAHFKCLGAIEALKKLREELVNTEK